MCKADRATSAAISDTRSSKKKSASICKCMMRR
jgi:hypothetical protein